VINGIIFWCLIVGIFMMTLSLHWMKLNKVDADPKDAIGCFLMCYIMLVGVVTIGCFIVMGIKTLINLL